MEERCASPGHWVIGGYSVTRHKRRKGHPTVWRIRLDGDNTGIITGSLDRAREVIDSEELRNQDRSR